MERVQKDETNGYSDKTLNLVEDDDDYFYGSQSVPSHTYIQPTRQLIPHQPPTPRSISFSSLTKKIEGTIFLKEATPHNRPSTDIVKIIICPSLLFNPLSHLIEVKSSRKGLICGKCTITYTRYSKKVKRLIAIKIEHRYVYGYDPACRRKIVTESYNISLLNVVKDDHLKKIDL